MGQYIKKSLCLSDVKNLFILFVLIILKYDLKEELKFTILFQLIRKKILTELWGAFEKSDVYISRFLYILSIFIFKLHLHTKKLMSLHLCFLLNSHSDNSHHMSKEYDLHVRCKTLKGDTEIIFFNEWYHSNIIQYSQISLIFKTINHIYRWRG